MRLWSQKAETGRGGRGPTSKKTRVRVQPRTLSGPDNVCLSLPVCKARGAAAPGPAAGGSPRRCPESAGQGPPRAGAAPRTRAEGGGPGARSGDRVRLLSRCPPPPPPPPALCFPGAPSAPVGACGGPRGRGLCGGGGGAGDWGGWDGGRGGQCAHRRGPRTDGAFPVPASRARRPSAFSGENFDSLLASPGPYNPFFVAPEVERQKPVTEKASVYCVAAILWAAAKFSLAPNQKLALPRKLKALLLDMARSSAAERPSGAQAMKVCSSYLHQRGMDSKKILAHLSTSPLQVYQEEESIGLQNALSGVALGAKGGTEGTEEAGPGFVPLIRDSELVAVKGPLSKGRGGPALPPAFTSLATHFKPIVLAEEAEVTKDGRAPPSDQCDRLEGPGLAPGAADGAESKEAEEQMAPPGAPTPPSGNPAQPRPPAGPTSPGVRQESEPLVPRDPAGASPPKNSFLPAQALEASTEVLEEPRVPGLPGGRDLKGHVTCGPPCSQGPPEAPGPEPKMAGSRKEAPSQPLQRGVLKSQGGEKEPGSSGPPLDPAKPLPDSAKPPTDPAKPPMDPAKPADRRPPSHSEASGQRRTIGPSLQRVMSLIQEEFAFDGYLENGLEALIMGEYIFALKDLTYATFCGAISEKFCDLYWDEKLLHNLFKVVNQKTSPPGGDKETDGSEWEDQGHDGQEPVSGPAGGRQSKYEAGKLRPRVSRTPGAAPSPTSLSEMDANELSQSNFEVGFRPQRPPGGEAQECSAEDSCLRGSPGGEGPAPGARSIAPSPCPAEFRSCSPGWCSAFYEADCFGPDVHTYVKKLGRPKDDGPQNADAPGLTPLEEHEWNQELEQQLMMEKRNYRKTLKFRQKLLQKEKRSRGSDVKTMLSKLKGQLEETKAKVQFLELVRKYLQVRQPWLLLLSFLFFPSPSHGAL
ncbi:kinase non-catalytic C-lobe domain-containing protein 1 [Sarcophilus harrisii]|uniref:kinase non-catalytic C-lobe domain-containing protein 1 n=1 Tax=Sarcophilus harrisii TaxID=9305 RepID=UPI001301C3D4|nr:kinase non-catalytic C-lobe domain-containing protein 1 [Sarcophilus harrisii]